MMQQEQPDIVVNKQYDLVTQARGILLQYCCSLKPEHLLQPVAVFNNTSIRNLLVHVANVYIHWAQLFALQQYAAYFEEEKIQDMTAVTAMYNQVNVLMERFDQHFLHRWHDPFTHTLQGSGKQVTTTPLAVFMHVTTHEFHHKGQILIMSRLLGYTPPDTDIIRT
ncbi:DinB family protein [Deminuibacter soli]|uniref:DUF664 domain-containing protein n=1 Tax=Deminuibacter soli TaxID=2291815 RepID=A0A3E1NC84_9BACT|nr:DinB family protein [Deminuibacter soli]RFM25625.1 DUF664 domain-containing protein [Deminuibacter soli]